MFEKTPTDQGSLMEAVIAKAGKYNPYFTDTIARIAILAVADWLERTGPGDDQIVGGGYAEFIAGYLRREVEV